MQSYNNLRGWGCNKMLKLKSLYQLEWVYFFDSVLPDVHCPIYYAAICHKSKSSSLRDKQHFRLKHITVAIIIHNEVHVGQDLNLCTIIRLSSIGYKNPLLRNNTALTIDETNTFNATNTLHDITLWCNKGHLRGITPKLFANVSEIAVLFMI